MAITTISIIGSGNVATHLAKVLYNKRFKIVNIWSRDINRASALANLVGANATSNLLELDTVDLIIICISDNAIEDISNSIAVKHSLIAHTSGSTSINVLQKHTNIGVLYPFQTFSKDIDIDFQTVPVFVEANSPENEKKLFEFAAKISSKVKSINSEQRMKLHLAAVFANNFSNHMLAIAKDILADANISFDILNHLIQETYTKAIISDNPEKVQTGPAVRLNYNIIEQHKEILAHKPLWQKIYTFVSNSIIERVTNKKNGTF